IPPDYQSEGNMDVSAVVGFRQRPGWFLAVAGLLLLQGWLTLRLFSPDLSFEHLLDDEPIISGRHALHYYHGMIGAKSWKERGSSCCFDPAYQAGYPKTPIFDGGSRPAELFQLLGGLRPGSYKLGLAIASLLVPFAFVLMGRGIGLSPPASCIAGLLGCMLWWSAPCQDLLVAGDVDLLLGGLSLLLHLTWFIRFERAPALDSWILMTLFAALTWYAQPFLVIGCLPFLVLYYFWVSARQGGIWHLAMVAAVLVAFGVNAAWLIEWTRHLWLYLPFGGQLPPSTPFWPTLAKQWNHMLPSDPANIGIAAVGLFGLLVMLRTNRAAAWLLGFVIFEFVMISTAGRFWPFLAEFGTEKLLILAAWCLVLPAANALADLADSLSDLTGWKPAGAIVVLMGIALFGWIVELPRQCLTGPRFEIGLSPQRKEIVRTLSEHASSSARILWEDRSGPGHGWTALLSPLSERPFLGGLDSEGKVEHMHARLYQGKLSGTSVKAWDERLLSQFFEHYNVGWVVCWTPESIERFRALPFARAVAEFEDGGRGVLFTLKRTPSFFLKGRGELALADSRRIALSDIVPDNGEIILSMHHQKNMRVSPGYVQIERYLDLNDPIPFIRLRCLGPVARVSIIWETP
ncbi:MAG: hypothetical protein K8T89_03360, partial [Planctomycetes bacterium]|nr:hypothetical protein [Planctomycetota bacterium]